MCAYTIWMCDKCDYRKHYPVRPEDLPREFENGTEDEMYCNECGDSTTWRVYDTEYGIRIPPDGRRGCRCA